MKLRYAGVCRLCGRELGAGMPAIYERATKTVRCIECSSEQASSAGDGHTPDAIDAAVESGAAGRSARREYERRVSVREERVRAKHPKLGGFLLAMSEEPQSTKAWETGAIGEERLGAILDDLVGPSVAVLHDRRIPGTRANIDHVVVCPTGILVVDAKRYKGRPHRRVDGGFLRERSEKLMVGTRDATRLVDGVLKQVEHIRVALAPQEPDLVRGYLCFVNAAWPLFGGSFSTRDVAVLWPKKLASVIAEPGRLSDSDVAAAYSTLAGAFPVA